MPFRSRRLPLFALASSRMAILFEAPQSKMGKTTVNSGRNDIIMVLPAAKMAKTTVNNGRNDIAQTMPGSRMPKTAVNSSRHETIRTMPGSKMAKTTVNSSQNDIIMASASVDRCSVQKGYSSRGVWQCRSSFRPELGLSQASAEQSSKPRARSERSGPSEDPQLKTQAKKPAWEGHPVGTPCRPPEVSPWVRNSLSGL